jgi:hypothetical protein
MAEPHIMIKQTKAISLYVTWNYLPQVDDNFL